MMFGKKVKTVSLTRDSVTGRFIVSSEAPKRNVDVHAAVERLKKIIKDDSNHADERKMAYGTDSPA